MGASFEERGLIQMTERLPPVVVANHPMPHVKAIELLTLLRNSDVVPLSQDLKNALIMATAALITEKLHLGGG